MRATAAATRNAVAVVAIIAGLFLSAITTPAISMDIDYDVDLCAGTGQGHLGPEVQPDQGD